MLLSRAWRECPICNQMYTKDLRLDMADAFIQMADQIDTVIPSVTARPYGPSFLHSIMTLKRVRKQLSQ